MEQKPKSSPTDKNSDRIVNADRIGFDSAPVIFHECKEEAL
jgi:hypothetical protein